MSKIVKLKQEDLVKLVENIVKEQEWKGSTDPDIMQLGQQGPEEIPGVDQYDDTEDNEKETDGEGVPLRLGKDDQGNYFVFQDDGSENPKIFKINK